MKKFICVLVIAVFTSCGTNNSNTSNADSTSTTDENAVNPAPDASGASPPMIKDTLITDSTVK